MALGIRVPLSIVMFEHTLKQSSGFVLVVVAVVVVLSLPDNAEHMYRATSFAGLYARMPTTAHVVDDSVSR